MKFFNTLLYVSAVAAAAGCASINNPEGGPKDLTPPTLLSSDPLDQQLNVNTNTITLNFDEDIQQNNLNRELQITPNLDNKFKVKMDDKELQLVFDNPLQENTTYILNFGKGIQDITEKNTAEGLKLAFSTGSFIDSSRVSGTVMNMLTNEPLKEAVVAMYPAMDTLSIRKNKPYYLARTNASGEFAFTNIKEGPYRIYAVQDANNNSLYDNENEAIAYKLAPIQVTPQEQQITLKAVKIDSKKPILTRKERFADRFTATYSEGLKNFRINKTGNTRDSLTYKLSVDRRTVELFKISNVVPGRLIFSAVDSSGNMSVDTVQVEFGEKFPQNIRGAQVKVTNTRTPAAYSAGSPLTVELQTPVRITGASPITIVSDSATRTSLKYPEQVKLDKTGTELSFLIPNLKTRKEAYTIRLDSTQLIPLTGPRITFPDQQLQLTEETGTGSVSGQINTTYKSFVVQLLNSANKVVAEQRNLKRYNFRNVEAGDYRIRVLLDENNNGQWDGPDPTFQREPEKVFFYSKPINIRPNWEMEDVNIDLQ